MRGRSVGDGWDDLVDYDADRNGQVDGDASGRVNFQPSTAQPWLRAGQPPWHLWGNTQRIVVIMQTFAEPLPQQIQLIKVAYKRPETWNWLFSARLLSGEPSVAFLQQVTVEFDLTVGIGRSAIQIAGPGQFVGNGFNAFERYQFVWGPAAGAFPRNAHIYTTEVLAPNRRFSRDPPFEDQDGNAVPPAQSATTIRSIVAQDIQLNARVSAVTLPGDASIGLPVEVEVSASFAPMTHVRPDWYLQAPDEMVFAGGETQGK